MTEVITAGAATIDLGELEEMVLNAYGIKFPKTIAVGLRESVLLMVADAVLNRLSGQYLNRVTGTLQRSVTASPPKTPEISPTMVRDWFGTNLDYGVAHERGFRGNVQIPAHTRRLGLTRVIKKGKRAGQRQKIGEKQRLQSALSGRKTVAHVRAHSRFMDIEAKHYLRDTLKTNTGKARLRIMRAMLQLFRTGRVPRAKEVRVAFR